MALNDEEYALFMEAMLEYENVNANGRVSIGKFMRDIVLPLFKEDNQPSIYEEIRKHDFAYNEIVSRRSEDTISTSINGDHPPSIPESKQEEVKNVSPAPEHTDSKLPDEWGFNLEE